MAQYAEMLSRPARPPKKELDHLRIHEAENGGHLIEHHFTSHMHEPEQHVFAEHEGHKLMAHIAKHMDVTLHDSPKEADKAVSQQIEDEHEGE